MDISTSVPPVRRGPYALTDDGIATLPARYEFHDSGICRMIVDQDFGSESRGRAVRLVIEAQVVDDPPQFTRFNGLLQVDLCAERFGNLRPSSVGEVFEGSGGVFEAVEGTWSVLKPSSV